MKPHINGAKRKDHNKYSENSVDVLFSTEFPAI